MHILLVKVSFPHDSYESLETGDALREEDMKQDVDFVSVASKHNSHVTIFLLTPLNQTHVSHKQTINRKRVMKRAMKFKHLHKQP